MRWIGWRIDRIGYASGIAYGKDAYQWMTRCTTCRPARDGAGHEPVKRKPVRPAELRLDDSKENLGLERVDYGYLSPYLETQETPADRVARRLITTPSMHSHRDNPQWWSLPVGHIGRIKAQKTAARWARARTLDGRTVKFSAVAFPIRDSDKNLWGVAISYDPADQPATEPHEPTADQPTFDTGH